MKPEYRVESMEEVGETKHNGFSVVSLFSGCGGSSLGYRMSGFKVLWANEFIPNQRAIYKANMAGGTVVNGSDIRSIGVGKVLSESGIKEGELDILDGSPPCKSFSQAVRDGAGDGFKIREDVVDYSQGIRQRTDDLFDEYIRMVEGIQPKIFVAENVPALSSGKYKGTFNEIFRKLTGAGYEVQAAILKCEFLGVPQKRHRLFIVGVRKDLKKSPVFPVPDKEFYTLREAFQGEQIEDSSKPYTWLNYTKKDGTRDDPRGSRLSNQQAYYVIWNDLPIGGHSHKRFTLIRSDPDLPSNTIAARQTGGGSGVMHWSEPRYWTISELKRICAFPDDFKLIGNYSKQAEALARSVPPVAMQRLAESLSGVLHA
jgi:DNA (cytosine-5)-methyltransferase 1